MRLDRFENGHWTRGRPIAVELLWILTSSLLVRSWLPGLLHRRFLLRLFGASIGRGVVIKPGVRVKFPWRLSVGDNSWIGEDAWIDNLAPVKIGSNACVSQGAYICTGSHDWSSETFDLITKPITIADGAWVAAKSTVGPGVTVGEGAVLGLGSTASKNLDPWCIYSGSPAKFVKRRTLRPSVGD
ncbi:MAG: colanic acid biosynthesis acetyltransferase WcaF [Hyphomonas sp.]|nr:colanic acid biosynthesis acetyltransferase WcaF [Hyphomonas sp.]